jgi:gliding motility-associated-like protein
MQMKYLLPIFLLLLNINGFCQPCSNPGQTVRTAFPVCGNTIFTQTNVPPCQGIPTPGGCSLSNSNPYFYKFTVVTPGTLGFIITPFNFASDYDFVLFNVTNAIAVTDIYTNPTLLKTANISAASGPTGCSAAGTNISCASGPFNQLQSVFAGEKYILIVVNFSSGASGYTLNFTGGTASISESLPIDFANANANCANNKITVKLNRTVKCNSIAANGTDFSLSPAAGISILSAASLACAAGEFSTDSVVLNLSAPLPANTYTITTQNGTDGNTLLGICDEQMAVGKTINFTTQPTQVQPKFLQVYPVACAVSKVKFQLSKPVLCSTIAADGSDFEITGPSNIVITSATFVCNGSPATTSEIELNTSAPITVGGTYILKAKNGTDNNTTIDVCGLNQTIGDNINFTIANVVNANFNVSIGFGCIKDTVFFTHPGNGATNWAWDFGDPASGILNTSNAQNPTHIYTSFGQKTVTLTVNNNACSNTLPRIINLDNEISSGFSIAPKDSVCLNTPLAFTSAATGNNLTHAWDFGNQQNSALQNPPSINYAQAGNYEVVYTITNNYNCSLIVKKPITILPLPSATYIVSANKICETKAVSFNLQNANANIKYDWNFGDGITNNTILNPTHIYTSAGLYTSSVIASTQYCGTDRKEIPINVLALPKVELGEDVTLCPLKRISLSAGTNPLFNYLWSTGQAAQAIEIAAIQSQQIKVAVTNDICIAQDSIFIKVLPSCTIFVPNAFSPNGDGKNDVFKVLNADLVKEFSLEVFNRYGEKIFVSNNALLGWDGTIKGSNANAGTYVWALRYRDTTYNVQRILNGTIILLR